MVGGLFGGSGKARCSGSLSSPVSVIKISLENSAICFFTTSCRLELSIFAYVLTVMMMSSLWFASFFLIYVLSLSLSLLMFYCQFSLSFFLLLGAF